MKQLLNWGIFAIIKVDFKNDTVCLIYRYECPIKCYKKSYLLIFSWFASFTNRFYHFNIYIVIKKFQTLLTV